MNAKIPEEIVIDLQMGGAAIRASLDWETPDEIAKAPL
jgi:hypothetical protein